MKKVGFICFMLVNFALSSCTTHTTRVNNAAGRPTIYDDPNTVQPQLKGVGIESQDIINMTDRMVRDIMQNPSIAARSIAPRVIMDAEYFHNESSSRINKNIITDRLRVHLNRSAKGGIIFIGRHYIDAVENERKLQREKAVDEGALNKTAATSGADYRLGGRITSMDFVNVNSQMKSRYHQVVFEMFDLETGIVVWNGIYEFKKTAQDDIIYR